MFLVEKALDDYRHPFLCLFTVRLALFPDDLTTEVVQPLICNFSPQFTQLAIILLCGSVLLCVAHAQCSLLLLIWISLTSALLLIHSETSDASF